MNYLAITKADIANGIGIRCCLWVSGCPHHCEGCHNPESHDYAAGKPFDEVSYNKLVKELSKPYYDGITLTGGDPLAEQNRDEVTEIAKRLKKDLPNKTIWCYTGYSWEDVKDLPIMQYIDVLIDGKFVLAQRDITLAWRGSRNQKVIDVPASLEAGSIVISRYSD